MRATVTRVFTLIDTVIPPSNRADRHKQLRSAEDIFSSRPAKLIRSLSSRCRINAIVEWKSNAMPILAAFNRNAKQRDLIFCYYILFYI